MCIAPVNIPDLGLVRCRKCWQCRKERVNDLVGRCIAEQKTADQTLAVTLTYAGDVPQAATLVYPDVQRFLKRLRKVEGRRIRYIVAGEYGSKKGRAHWHIILFVSGVPIPLASTKDEQSKDESRVYVAQEKRDHINWTAWPHGHVLVQHPDHGSFRYVLKYVLKDLDAEVQRTHLAMSKKPPLGCAFFQNLAQAHVNQGLAPQSLQYEFRDVRDRRNRVMRFILRGRMAELYLDTFRALWSVSRGSQPPESDLLLEREDRLLRQQFEAKFDLGDWLKRLSEKRYAPPPLTEEEREAEETLEGFKTARYFIDPETGIIVDIRNNGSAVISLEGSEPWQAKNQDDLAAKLQMLRADLSSPQPSKRL